MAKIDPPYRLDPLKNIIEVGWGSTRYAIIRVELAFNFGTPGTMGYLDVPKNKTQNMNWQYPFNPLPTPMTNRREGKNGAVPVDPVTVLTTQTYHSWGTGTVQLPTPDIGTRLDVWLYVSLSQNFAITVELPATLPAQGGEDILLHDGYVYTTFTLVFGQGEGYAAFFAMTDAQMAEMIAIYNAEVASGALDSFQVVVERTYTEAGTPRKFNGLREMFVELHKFQKDPNNPSAPAEDIDISSEIEGQQYRFYTENTTSDSPKGVKRFLVEWKTKTRKLSITPL